ncbi:hypothetical protein ACJJH9_05170 [Microbulbifer sp. DLAB2-AF]|uniref:hypothetical protein n=1 Tax=unclassified Microbulbifer TaxID=2619833 RepID=UPI00403B376E
MSILYWLGLGGLAVIAFYLFKKWKVRLVEWKPEEVANLLESWIKDDVDYKRWDYFEACEIANPKLEVIRQRAIKAIHINSPYIEVCGRDEGKLNEKGKELFKELRKQCF